MVKKLLVLAAAICALASLVAPTAATATPRLTSGGVPVPPGTLLRGTANNTTLRFTTETGLGELECEEVTLNGEVTENSGTSIKGVGAAGSTTSGCSFEGVETAEVAELNFTEFSSNMVEGETGTGVYRIVYIVRIPGGAECKFSNVGKAAGVFHYTLGSDIIHLTRTNVTGSGCGESFLHGTLTLETTNGQPVIWS